MIFSLQFCCRTLLAPGTFFRIPPGWTKGWWKTGWGEEAMPPGLWKKSPPVPHGHPDKKEKFEGGPEPGEEFHEGQGHGREK